MRFLSFHCVALCSFFNVTVGRSLLENEEQLRTKLLYVIQNCHSITS
jgi:hypothetical protein